jgi:hypothetical protein
MDDSGDQFLVEYFPGNKTMKCLENLLTSNALRDTLCSESYKRGGENAGILHEVQKEG